MYPTFMYSTLNIHVFNIKSILPLPPRIHNFCITSSLTPCLLSYPQDFAQAKASYVLSEIFNSSSLLNSKIKPRL